MDKKSPTSSDRLRTNWTPSMDRYFIDLVLDQVHKGNMADNACRKQIWMHMITLFNAKFGSQYDKDVLRNRYKTLRRQYNDIKILLDQSGFSWDETRQMVIADDIVWDDYIKAHPDVRSYRTKILPYFNDMCVIYGNATADGRNNCSSHDVDLDDDSLEMKFGGLLEDLQSLEMPLAYREEVDDVQEDSSYPCRDMMRESTEELMVDDLSERTATVPSVMNKQKENDSSIPVTDVQEDFLGGNMVMRNTKNAVDSVSEREATVSLLANKKDNGKSIPVDELQRYFSHLDEEMVGGNTAEGMVDALSDNSVPVSLEVNRISAPVDDVQEGSSHSGQDIAWGSTEEGTLDAPWGEAAMSLSENKKKESDNSILAGNLLDDSYLGGGMVRESTEGDMLDALSNRAASVSSLAYKKKENDSSTLADDVQEDSSNSGGDTVRESTEVFMVDALSDMTVGDSLIANDKKENNSSILIDSLQDSSHLSADMVKGNTNKSTMDALYETGVVVSPVANKKEETDNTMLVDNVQEDTSNSGKDMVKESTNEVIVDALSETMIVVSSVAKEKDNNHPIQAESRICALQAAPYTSPTTDFNRSRVTWTPTMDRYFINLMLDHVRRGNKIGRSFNKQAWMDMTVLFNEKFGFQYDKDVLKNRYKTLRRQYTDIKILLGQNGFGWDGTLQMVTADVYIWDDYVKAHPNARQYRTRPMPYYGDLCVIYGNAAVNGKYSFSGHNVSPDDDVHGTKDGGVLRGLNSPAMSVVHKDLVDDVQQSSHLGEDMDISGQQNKRQSMRQSTSQYSKRARRSADEGMVNALREMATAVTSLADKKENDNSVSIENVIGAVQAIPDIDEDLLLDACDLLEDERKARTFLALDFRLRKKWLMRKLRP
ncbi:hypothetical protein HHK36_012336 [Tetracentron sinense]|uniref:Myb/SANT-like domain-containing protein n=1 Tax=Tetracentron sinense TaxID=13715 RepID=A0A835DFF8_TETSI|nr:hypothetical protein HHK36_012336 [Tetracentron sinense]